MIQTLKAFGGVGQLTLVSKSPAPAWLQSDYHSPTVRLIRADLSQGLPIDLANERFDVVIHAATYGQPKKFLDHSIETLRLNANLTEELLTRSCKQGSRFLFMSSSEIYGSPPPEFCPLNEDFPGFAGPVEPRAVYTSSKRYGETLTKVYSDTLGIEGRIARVSSVYGPGVRWNDDRAINLFIRKALTTGELNLQDSGSQLRRWLDISDALRMLFFILTDSRELVYNVAGDDLRSIAELAEMIRDETKCRLQFPAEKRNDYVTKGAPTLIDVSAERIRHEAKLPQLRRLQDIVRSCVGWHRYLMSAGESRNEICNEQAK
jgi:dTDP-glucose 4,6-dehydratase/UDP-glucuronate decarboxylase